MRIRIAATLLVFALILSCQLQAQAIVDLQGTVTTPDGSPVPDARVSARRVGAITRETATDEAGRYRIDELTPATYVVSVSARGFASEERRVEVLSDTMVDVTITAAAFADTVVVTAQKREEEAATLPVSVAAFTAQQVDAYDLRQLRQVPDVVPNFRMTDTGGRATYSYITLRGFINQSTSVDPAAAVYVDGIPFGDFFSLNQALFDVERIEVSKGPQSTLYGVNSEAGVVNIVSQRPGDVFRGSASGSLGAYGAADSSLAVSGPLVRGKLFGSIAATVDGHGGFLRNLSTGRRYNTQRGQAVRGRLIWNPTAQWDVAATVFGQHLDDVGGYHYMPTDVVAYQRLIGTASEVGPYDIALDTDGFNRGTTTAQAIQVKHLRARVEFVYTGAHRQANQRFGFDADLTPVPQQNGRLATRIQEWNHELRAQSPDGSRAVAWTVGLNVTRGRRRQGTVLEALPANVFGLRPGEYELNDSDLATRNHGAFGQVTARGWDHRIGITGGLRYDRVARDLARAPELFGFPGIDATATHAVWLPKVTVDVRVTPSVLAYATAGRGWRAGGLSPVSPTVGTARYRPEISWTYEAGLKATSPDRRARATAAVFVNDVRDFHDQLTRGPLLAYLGNARAVTIKGADIDGSVTIASGLELSGSLGLTSARYDDYLYDAASGLRFDGKRLRQVPSADYSLAGQYQWPRWPIFTRVELTGVGGFDEYMVNLFAGSVRTFEFGDYAVVNLRAGYDTARWGLTGFVTNLTNRAYFTNTEGGYGGLSAYTEPLGIRGARRVVGTRLTFRF